MPLNIIELREYTLHPGQRDVLIELFDREFVETQEAVGIRVLGQFRDVNRPDRFVWLRGFESMPQRASALGAFYGGPVWKRHREAANATMIDSDNVLLLRPAWEGSVAALEAHASEGSGEILVATVCSLKSEDAIEAFARFFRQQLQPSLVERGIHMVAALKTEHAKNTFPALPVREGEHTFVWLSGFTRRERFEAWLSQEPYALRAELFGARPQSFFLEATSGSRLRPRRSP